MIIWLPIDYNIFSSFWQAAFCQSEVYAKFPNIHCYSIGRRQQQWPRTINWIQRHFSIIISPIMLKKRWHISYSIMIPIINSKRTFDMRAHIKGHLGQFSWRQSFLQRHSRIFWPRFSGDVGQLIEIDLNDAQNVNNWQFFFAYLIVLFLYLCHVQYFIRNWNWIHIE